MNNKANLYKGTLLEILFHIINRNPEFSNVILESLAPGFGAWRSRSFTVPCPKPVKDHVLLRYGIPNCTWIETGTATGATTATLLNVAQRVITIEPAEKLFKIALARFADNENVQVINGISENILPKLLPTLVGDICFWLDGHFSGGDTYSGPNETAVFHELEAISNNLERFGNVVVFVDDVREFRGRPSYPSLDYLVDWARGHNMNWQIEFDIFIASSQS
jgi:hypothetical protein